MCYKRITMRLKNKQNSKKIIYNLLIVDDDPGIIDTLKIVVNKEKFKVTGFTDPYEAIVAMKKEKFDILVLDFLLEKSTGKEIVKAIRKFNSEIYIILLTGYKDMAPPLKTLQELDIQGYCEKSDRFDQLILIIESAVKSIILTKKLIKFHDGMNQILDTVPSMYTLRPIKEVVNDIFNNLLDIAKVKNAFILCSSSSDFSTERNISMLRGVGKYNLDYKDLLHLVHDNFSSFIRKVFKDRIIIFENESIFLSLSNEFGEDCIAIYAECTPSLEIQDIIRVFLSNAQSSYNNAILHSIVSKKNNDLSTMLRQLHENIERQKSLENELHQSHKMEVLGRLTGGIAHDFNNILVVITGYSKMLLTRIKSSDPIYKKVSQIQIAGERASELIKQLLAFSRKQKLIRKPVFVNEIIMSIRIMVEAILSSTIEFEYNFCSTIWKALIDKSQLEQVLMNLIVNARDAMPNGGKIFIQTNNLPKEQVAQIQKTEMQSRDYVHISLADTGSGIPKKIVSKIFDPFFTTKSPGQGTGLGLSTVYGIVKQMEGYIYVESVVNRGTTFNIYLPKTDEKIVPEVGKKMKSSLKGNESILVVDDEKDVVIYIKSILSEEGYKAYSAFNADEAYSVYEKNKIDLVLTDIIMPCTNGKQLVQNLFARNERLKILFMSGYVNSDLIEQGFYFSENNFIEKPFTKAELIGKMRDIFDNEYKEMVK